MLLGGVPISDETFEVMTSCSLFPIIALPNMSYWKFRLRFLKGKNISNKYIFSPVKVLDRHRWLTSYNSAIDFVAENSNGHEVIIKTGFYQYRSKFLRFIDSYFSRKFFVLYILIFPNSYLSLFIWKKTT